AAKFFELLEQTDQTLIFDHSFTSQAGFATEAEYCPIKLNGDMPGPKCRQSIRIVLANILFVADADGCQVEQCNHTGQHSRARQLPAAEIARHLGAELRQKFFAWLQAKEFGLIRNLAPLLVVDVLFASAIVAAGGLQMPIGLAADPDIG